MNLRNLDMNLLPVFDCLMREQHLSRSAESLGMSQPAVSNALKRLRLSFADELFVRTGRGLKPTARARELQKSLQPALQLIRQGCAAPAFDPATSDQVLTISMNPASEYLLAPGLMAWLRQTAPGMKVEIQPDYLDDIPARLKDGSLAYALEYMPWDDLQFQSVLLNEPALSVICARGHAQINGAISLDQFTSLPQVTLVRRSGLMHGQGHARGTPIEQIMGTDLPPRNIALHVSSFVALPDIIAETDLIGIVPTMLARQARCRDRLQILDLPFDCPPVSMRLYWHKSRNNDPAHHWFLAKMQDIAAILG